MNLLTVGVGFMIPICRLITRSIGLHEAKQKHIKVKDFITNVLPHLDAALQADYLKSDAAAIALLMRKTSALRSGSTPMGSGKVETYGAASLRRSHVHMDEVRRPMTATEMLARSPEEVRAGVHHAPDWQSASWNCIA